MGFVKIFFHLPGGQFHKSDRIYFVEKRPLSIDKGLFFGADDEARTRYLHLGKVALYQMSYVRISDFVSLVSQRVLL